MKYLVFENKSQRFLIALSEIVHAGVEQYLQHNSQLWRVRILYRHSMPVIIHLNGKEEAYTLVEIITKKLMPNQIIISDLEIEEQ